VRLETERLVLRKPEPGDLNGYADVWADPEVVRYLSGSTLPRNRVPQAIERMLLHWERHGVGLFSVLRKEDGRFVGRVGYLLWDPERWVNAMHEQLDGDLELEIGWTIAHELWGNGYATEAAAACRDHAFSELGRDHVISLIAPENVASIRVAEKIGESYERDVELPHMRVGLYSVAA
jgi:RimJ/RimL family protein N-acetyltransferase